MDAPVQGRPLPSARVRSVLICHADNALSREVLPAVLASFSELVGIVVIAEPPNRMLKRLKAELKRSRLRILDVLAFRLVYQLHRAGHDRRWLRAQQQQLAAAYGTAPAGVPLVETADPNSEATRRFLEDRAPDVVLARCKTLLRRSVFDVPRLGTLVVHPGICPEYRNAHGCFWALAQRDLDRVGATLLRIDEGIDTGPPLAYYHADFDEYRDSHVVIQHKVVYDNLDRMAADIASYVRGELGPVDTAGRDSGIWGQPRLTDWLRWKRAARRTARVEAAEARSSDLTR